MRYSRFLLLSLLIGVLVSAEHSFLAAPAEKKSEKTGDQVEYFKKWVDEDVAYIITTEERNVFKALKNDEERESFIEQFWSRRNPDPRSPYNMFKEEHYRRITYANERFQSGMPGWKTDRGRIYITFGPPDDIEDHPTGGFYARRSEEGGGTTSTYAFQRWWYRHLDGVGDGVEIEFVDPTASGEYRIALNADEKDALLYVPNAGLTLAEQAGAVEKRDRASLNPAAWNDPDGQYANYLQRFSPMARMEQYFKLQRPPQIKFEDLKSLVSTRVTFSTLPYDVRTDYIRLSPEKVLALITIELSNSELEFKKELDFNKATVNVYGIVTSLTNKIAAEWEDTIVTEFSDEYFTKGKDRRSEYQKMVSVPPGQRYKLDVVLKDVNSEEVGALSTVLVAPKYEEGVLGSSSIILANSISRAPTNSDQLRQYVIGDMKIVPNVKAEYDPGDNLISYMQIYDMGIDQTSQKPSLDITFTLKSNGEVVREMKSSSENSEQFSYGERIVLLGRIPLKEINPGKYTLEIKVLDKIAGRTHSTSTGFTVNGVQKLSAAQP